MIRFRIKEHLIIPFGRPKWDISKIRLISVSTVATHFESDTPCVHIDKTKDEAIRFEDFPFVFPETEKLPDIDNPIHAFDFACEYIKTDCNLQTPSERLFLDLYAQYCKEVITPHHYALKQRKREELSPPWNDDDWVFAALIPLPQAHLYLEDPLKEPSFTDEPSFTLDQVMVKVDFAFWDGKRIIAVEVDGGSHIGSEKHIRKDRLLSRAGVETIHIHNSELKNHGTKVICRLLPTQITKFWEGIKFCHNPLKKFPF